MVTQRLVNINKAYRYRLYNKNCMMTVCFFDTTHTTSLLAKQLANEQGIIKGTLYYTPGSNSVYLTVPAKNKAVVFVVDKLECPPVEDSTSYDFQRIIFNTDIRLAKIASAQLSIDFKEVTTEISNESTETANQSNNFSNVVELKFKESSPKPDTTINHLKF